MADSRKVVRIFLGSPGDLGEERRVAKSIVDEFNGLWADEFGYHVELVGWEDTVSSFGRPQATINRDLERCELFVGIIWKRWGTPPDRAGVYTSGFEEELEISIANTKLRGKPSISLFFKTIDSESQRDPGDQLKRVIALRESIITKKELYFEEFDNVHDFQTKFRRCVTRYVQSLRNLDASQLPNESTKPEISVATSAVAKLISEDGVKFLHEITSKIEGGAEVNQFTANEVARLRLIGIILLRAGNDEQSLGIHDANLLFNARKQLKIGVYEIYGLILSGLAHFPAKSTPLWYWLAVVDGLTTGLLPHISIAGFLEYRTGALQAMRYCGT